jgi:hypothetical protein
MASGIKLATCTTTPETAGIQICLAQIAKKITITQAVGFNENISAASSTSII